MVILEGNKGIRWETLRMKISSVLKIPFGAIVVRQIEVVNLEKLVGDVLRKVKHSYTRVVEEEGQRKGVIILIRKWARVVICESGVGMQDWVDLGKIIAKNLASRARKIISEGRPHYNIGEMVTKRKHNGAWKFRLLYLEARHVSKGLREDGSITACGDVKFSVDPIKKSGPTMDAESSKGKGCIDLLEEANLIKDQGIIAFSLGKCFHNLEMTKASTEEAKEGEIVHFFEKLFSKPLGDFWRLEGLDWEKAIRPKGFTIAILEDVLM
ncbi:hypothetical protein CK203_046972 [Vitis vinifera]|uniref:DUF4283 domain-containing protein n=1 Tax=Vitis vinifera TaxID=29760 RepID=A0A438FWK5_VITVI|nr:hypothetical protein CK203_046972 [Vitis vinifera]